MKSINWKRWNSTRRIASYAVRLVLVCLLVVLSSLSLIVSPVQAASIGTVYLPDGEVGVSYSGTIMASGSPPFVWTISGLPSGLTPSYAGYAASITGTPTTPVVNSPIYVTVTDNVSTANGTYYITIVDSTPTELTFIGSSMPSGTEGSSYSASIPVTGGTSPYTWSITSGTLPSGLILSANTGVISGTPSSGTYGTHSFSITVTDSSSPALIGERSFNIYIERGSYEPTVTIGPGLDAGKTKVYAGGSQIATLGGGESVILDVDLGTNVIVSIDSVVDHPSDDGVRFKTDIDETTLTEYSSSVMFTYYTEYYIEIDTRPSGSVQLTGSGWYKEEYKLSVSAPDEVTAAANQDTQYRFSHWQLPTGETSSNRDLSLTVSMPGTATANYDTYYKLTLMSAYGDTEGSSWYEAGSEAQWGIGTDEVRMSGFLGLFGGKLKAVNSSGTEIIDSPKTVTVTWEPDYTMPMILIPLAILLIIIGGYMLYRMWGGLQPKPAPVPPFPQPMPPFMPHLQPLPPPQTTVVMIGDTAKKSPQTTREQLMEKFGELLEKYEQEISTSLGAGGAAGAPRIGTVGEDKRLSLGASIPPAIVEGEVASEEEESECGFTGKKLLRTVTRDWRQAESKAVELPPTGKKTKGSTGIGVVWARDIYNEWEIVTCSLPHGHEGEHQGSVEIAYSLLNTVTEEKVYSARQKPNPPTPHYTDGMLVADITDDQIVSTERLPDETIS